MDSARQIIEALNEKRWGDLTPSSEQAIRTALPDGRIAIDCTIALTPAQWAALAKHHHRRSIACGTGIDNPHLADFVLQQIFEQAT